MLNGIDVSKFQGNIDWSRVKTDFAIIRAGYGSYISQKDEQFEANYRGCKNNKIPCGAYWFSYALSPDEARREADVCLDVIKGKQYEFPIFLDIEDKRQMALGRDRCSEIAKTFLDKVEKAGYWVGIYSSASFLSSYISEEIRTRYSVWVANYGVAKPSYNGTYALWQKSNTGSVSGISGNVDLDECTVDFPSEIRAAGLNGFPKPSRKTKMFTITFDNTTYSGELTEK